MQVGEAGKINNASEPGDAVPEAATQGRAWPITGVGVPHMVENGVVAFAERCTECGKEPGNDTGRQQLGRWGSRR